MCKSRIPVKTACFELGTSKGDVTVDTAGLDCTLRAVGGNVYFKTAPGVSDNGAFVIPQNESIEFCGKVYLSGADGTSASAVFMS